MRSLISRVQRLLRRHLKPFDPLEYWKTRATAHGPRSVLNLAHPPENYDLVTRLQAESLFPIFFSTISTPDPLVLDYGCGSGRFTNLLARESKATVIGSDITAALLRFATHDDQTFFVQTDESSTPFVDCVFDAIWVYSVLGGIPDETVTHVFEELGRVLRQGGTLFLVENTSPKRNRHYWFYRSERDYVRLAQFCNLQPVYRFDDLSEQMSTFVGIKW